MPKRGGSEGGRGFDRLGQPGLGRKNSENVLPFDADRTNAAIERAAKQLEFERRGRIQGTTEKQPPQEPTFEEIDPVARDILEKTQHCDQQLAVEIQATLLQQNPDQRSYVYPLAHMSDEFIAENAEYTRAFALTFLQLEAARKRIQTI